MYFTREAEEQADHLRYIKIRSAAKERKLDKGKQDKNDKGMEVYKGMVVKAQSVNVVENYLKLIEI